MLVAMLVLLLVSAAVGGLYAQYVYDDWKCAIARCVKVRP